VMLVGCLELVAAIFLCQVLRGTLNDPNTEDHIREFLWRYFGTTGRACYTMFEITFGVWPPVARFIIEEVNGYLVFFWVFYIVVVAFTIMNIVKALFIRETIAVANREGAAELEERSEEGSHDMEVIQQILRRYDEDNTGNLDIAEFRMVLADKDVQLWLDTFEVCPKRLLGVYDLLTRNGDNMCIEEFISIVFSLREDTVDAVTLMYSTEKIIQRTTRIEKMMEQVMTAVQVQQPPPGVE